MSAVQAEIQVPIVWPYFKNTSVTHEIGFWQAAIKAYGKEDVLIWVRYAKLLEKSGQGYGNLAWRASKNLESPEDFVALMSQSVQAS